MDWSKNKHKSTNPSFASCKSKVPHGHSSLSLVPLCHSPNGRSKGGQELVMKEAVHKTELLEKGAAGTRTGSVADLRPMAPTLGYSTLFHARYAMEIYSFCRKSEIRFLLLPFHFGCCSGNLHSRAFTEALVCSGMLWYALVTCHLGFAHPFCGFSLNFSGFLWIQWHPQLQHFPAISPQKKYEKARFQRWLEAWRDEKSHIDPHCTSQHIATYRNQPRPI